MTTPTPRPAQTDGTEPISLTVRAQMRDGELNICGHGLLTFTYDPRDPYALSLTIADPWGLQQPEVWTASREVFAAAALWGVDMPGMDLSVQTLTVTRATPGQPVRDVPCLRITLRETDMDSRGRYFTRSSMYLDIVRADIIRYFQMTTDLVPVGKEHRYMDIDAAIAGLLNRTPQEEL